MLVNKEFTKRGLGLHTVDNRLHIVDNFPEGGTVEIDRVGYGQTG